MVRLWSSRAVRLIPVAALLLALVVAVGPVAAADPTTTANPVVVPFNPTPGVPGTTTLTFTANGTAGLSACGQDNAQPPFALGPVDPATPLVLPFPYIQAGEYTFWVSADSTCKGGTRLGIVRVDRADVTGAIHVNSVHFLAPGASVAKVFDTSAQTRGTLGTDVLILGASATAGATQQTFPIPGMQLCIMSSDGSTMPISMTVGQDVRADVGLGAAAAVTAVNPIAGQNGCWAIPWIVNGGYTAGPVLNGKLAGALPFGYCVPAASLGANAPSVPSAANGVGKCAQVAFSPAPGSIVQGTSINGSIVTGADNHAVEVCVSAFMPSFNPFVPVPILVLPNTANAYNQSGAVNLTPLKLAFPSATVTQVTTYDITGPGPGGQGGAQFACPPTTGIQGGLAVTIVPASVPGASIIDIKNYTIA